MTKVFVELPEPTLDGSQADCQRLQEALTKTTGKNSLQMGLHVMHQLPALLRQSKFAVTALLGARGSTTEVMDVESGDSSGRNCLLVVDIGTTTVVAHLVNVPRMTTVDAVAGINPQALYAHLVDVMEMPITDSEACFNAQSVYGREVTAQGVGLQVIVTSATGSSTVWEFWMRVPAPWFALSFRWLQTYGIAYVQNDGAALVSAASAGTAYLSRWMGTPWQSVTYLNSCTTYTGWSQPAKYRRDANGNVFVTGMIQGGTPGATSVVFTLPSGFRPADQLLFGTQASGGTSARIDVQTDGDVIVSTGSTTWTTLSGVQFLADGS